MVIGLGNPGPEYAATRHNVGFVVLDEVARRLRAGPWTCRHYAQVCRTTRRPAIILAKPATYMNRSGLAVGALLGKLELPPDRALVVVDDIDLPLGRLRLRSAGGPGTHNGLRDIVAAVGPGFARLRVGVRGVGEVEDLASYVLSDFSSEEHDMLTDSIRRAADAVEAILEDGLSTAMNVFNRPPPIAESCDE